MQTEAWAGHAAGTEEAIRVFGADCSYPLQLLSEVSPVLLLVDSSLVWIDHQALWKSTYFCTFAFSKKVQELSVLLIYNFDMVQILPQFIARAKAIYCDLGFLNPIVQELPQFQEAIQQGKVRSLNKYSQLVRWVKSSAELELMRQAAAITSKVCLGCHPSCVSFCSYWPLVLRSSKYCGCGLGLIV